MPLNLVLVPQRQSPKGIALSWGPMEGVASYQIFIGKKKMSPEELEKAQLLGGTDECAFLKAGSEVRSVVDDLTPPGEPRYYGVAMVFDDGSIKAARFRALADGATAESFPLSSLGKRDAGPAARPAPRATPAAAAASGPAAAPRGAPPAPALAEEDPLEARKRAQREARAPAAPAPAAPAPAARAPSRDPEPVAAARSAPEEDPLEARQRAQAAARAARPPDSEGAARPQASAEPTPPPSAVPLQGALELKMSGATQTWDGLRIHWQRSPSAAAYEIIASDHQIFGDEVADALAGTADFTSATAVPPSVTCVIDNVTAREARGWFAVLVRERDGKRVPHPFEVGDAASSGRTAAPFLNPNRTGEIRAEAEELVAQAQEQWARWQGEQDGGARREAKRLLQDALLIFPGHTQAARLAGEFT